MVTRKGFFGYMGAIVAGLLGSSALASSSPLAGVKSLKLRAKAVPLPPAVLGAALGSSEALPPVAGWEADFRILPSGLCTERVGSEELPRVCIYYGLFSFEGNHRLGGAVEGWGRMLTSCTKEYGVEHIAVDLVDIAKDHPEVFDTAVRERIMDRFGSFPCSDQEKTLALSKFLKANEMARTQFAEEYCVSPEKTPDCPESLICSASFGTIRTSYPDRNMRTHQSYLEWKGPALWACVLWS